VVNAAHLAKVTRKRISVSYLMKIREVNPFDILWGKYCESLFKAKQRLEGKLTARL